VVTTRVHVGDTISGRITATIPVVGLNWTDVLNGNGTIDVTVTEDVVRDFDLRQKTHGARCFLAVEVEGRIKQAGPIWARAWDWEKGQLTLGASGMWSMADKRIIYDPATFPSGILSFTGLSLGGVAVSLVSHMLNAIPPYTNLPIVLPAAEAGDHEESFPRWNLARYGEQLRQLTQRSVDAPDIRFQPRRKESDPRYIEWVMQVGTEASPSLSQGGPDWVFDSSAPKSPVLGIATDGDASDMGEQAWATGNGSEADMKLATAASLELLDLGWPLTEVDESHSTVEDNDILAGHANSLLGRSARPIEVFKVKARANAYNEVLAGDYARTITRGVAWLGDMDVTTRVKQVSGDLSDELRFDMFSVLANL
jgi:hypothetical protein